MPTAHEKQLLKVFGLFGGVFAGLMGIAVLGIAAVAYLLSLLL